MDPPIIVNLTPKHGFFKVKTGFTGKIAVDKDGKRDEYNLGPNVRYVKTDTFNIAFTTWGDKGPVVLFLHGVPANRRQW